MQKKVGNALYVFDTTPFTITADTDAEVIYVQQEYLKGYLELNTELADKIHGFNQFLMTIKPAPWADGGTPGPGPGPEPTPNYHLLTLSDANNIYLTGYNSEQLPGEYSNDWFSEINRHQIDAGMINGDEGNKIYCNAGAKVFLMTELSYFETMTGLELIQTDWGEKYGFVMGDSDMTVDFSYTLKPKYHVNFTEDSNANADIEIAPSNEMVAGQDVYIRFLNGQSSSTVVVTSNDVELTYNHHNDEYYFIMPDHDVNIKTVYNTQPKHNINFTEDSNASRDINVAPSNQMSAGTNVYIRFLNGQSSSTITVTSTDVELTYDQPNDEYSFTMPEKDVNIKAVYKPKYNINFTEDSNASRDINVAPSNQMIAGNTVFLQFKNNQSSSSIAVTSNDVELTYDQPNDEYSFTMPEKDVNIKAVYTQPVYNVNFTADSNATADVKIIPQQTVAGHKVNIEFLNGQSRSTIEVTSNDVRLKYNPNNGKYNFTMPGNDVNIKAVYKQPIQISIDLGGTDLTCASYEPSGTYYPHASFVVQVPVGKTPENYTFVTSDNEHIVVNPIENRFEVEFMVSGTITFANA